MWNDCDQTIPYTVYTEEGVRDPHNSERDTTYILEALPGEGGNGGAGPAKP